MNSHMMFIKAVCGLFFLLCTVDCSLTVVGNLAVVGKPKTFVGTASKPVLAQIGKLWCGAQILGEKTPITYGQFTRLRDGKVFEGGLSEFTTFLDIKEAPATVAGKYKCEIRTSDEQIATGFCFIYLPPILVLPTETQYEEKPDSKVATIDAAPLLASAGDTVRFSCPVYGFPPPYVTWEKDGTTLGSNVSYEGDDIIVNISQESEGTYTCTADNSFPMFVDGPAMPHKLVYNQKLVVMNKL
ncbi:unnamed protein product [Auanema sp. JU1783]|nr:unnamed protein product [Auanema sp. JU1783]